jgi:energy-coupling factor transporter transmembrane protein EcfT
MIGGPMMVMVVLKWWSLLPIAATIALVRFAARREWARYWLGIALSIAITVGTIWFTLYGFDMNTAEGPELFGLAFLMGGIFGWYIDIFLISFIAGRLAWKRELQTLGE